MARKIILMPPAPRTHTVNELFFQPLTAVLASARHTWPCPEFPDEVWLHMGVQRVLEASESGRGFLQEHGLRFQNPPGYNSYFASLRCQRTVRTSQGGSNENQPF